MKKSPSSDLNYILHKVQDKYGCESTTSFLENCLSFAFKDFFWFDVISKGHSPYLTSSSVCEVSDV